MTFKEAANAVQVHADFMTSSLADKNWSPTRADVIRFRDGVQALAWLMSAQEPEPFKDQ